MRLVPEIMLAAMLASTMPAFAAVADRSKVDRSFGCKAAAMPGNVHRHASIARILHVTADGAVPLPAFTPGGRRAPPA